ncbi:NUDIX domain-containing protein [Candidatus Woesearchaeota archaeon]|nr:NUDIX domain-containing protein [Candidatus Woesearchaeota archaeon]
MKQVECIVFRKKDNTYEFLLLKRKPQEGDFWQPICGNVEKHERLIDAAYRELLEESNIKKKDIVRIIPNVYVFIVRKHHIIGEPLPYKITEYVFGIEVQPSVNVSIQNNPHKEHEQFKWVSFKEALDLLKWEDNKKAFIKLYSLLNEQG